MKIGEDGKVVLVEAEPTRMLHANALAYKVIFARAERGLDLDIFLRMQRDAHEALRPGKDEAAKDGERRPIRPVFELARTTTEPPPELTASPRPPAGVPLTVDGQVYE